MSPRIELEVKSIAYDEANLILYVSIFQIFRIWAIPFHRSPVHFTTVLQLNKNKADGKYYIEAQNDLYQVDQFVRFFVPYGGHLMVLMWHAFATLFSLLGAIALWPVSLIEELVGGGAETKRHIRQSEPVNGIGLLEAERKGLVNGAWVYSRS